MDDWIEIRLSDICLTSESPTWKCEANDGTGTTRLYIRELFVSFE